MNFECESVCYGKYNWMWIMDKLIALNKIMMEKFECVYWMLWKIKNGMILNGLWNLSVYGLKSLLFVVYKLKWRMNTNLGSKS